eukprot:14138532-Ditylum_brightwellii.AAC.1
MERSKQIKCVDGNKNNGIEDSVEDSDDGGDKHLTHLTKSDDCCLMEKSKQNMCADDDNGYGVDDSDNVRSKQKTCVVGNKSNGIDNSVDDSDDGANKHLTHLSQVDDCHLTWRSKQIKCVDGDKDYVVDDSDDNSDLDGDKHLTHLTQVENNVDLGVCDRHLTHVVKNNLTSLISDVTGH